MPKCRASQLRSFDPDGGLNCGFMTGFESAREKRFRGSTVVLLDMPIRLNSWRASEFLKEHEWWRASKSVSETGDRKQTAWRRRSSEGNEPLIGTPHNGRPRFPNQS